MTVTAILSLTAYGAAGATLGVFYFLLLHRTVRIFTEGGAVLGAVSLTAARLTLAVLVFWWIVQAGAAPLIAALAGFVAARIATGRMVRAP